jgi:uncharacterized membrane protein YczE
MYFIVQIAELLKNGVILSRQYMELIILSVCFILGGVFGVRL